MADYGTHGELTNRMEMENETQSATPWRAAVRPRTIITMPAFNAAKTLLVTYRDIPRDLVSEIILVDDASTDGTLAIAERLGLRVIAHPHNVGYGGNQKTCYLEALRRGADIVIMIHADNQYDPAFIPEMIKPIERGEADIVFGSRMRVKGAALRGGMPVYKFVANRILTFIENLAFKTSLTDCHTGYRAYSKRFLQAIPFMHNSNDFVFDSQVIMQAAAFGYRIAEVPVTTKYFKDASSVNFWVSSVYGTKTLFYLFSFLLARLRLWNPKFLRR